MARRRTDATASSATTETKPTTVKCTGCGAGQVPARDGKCVNCGLPIVGAAALAPATPGPAEPDPWKLRGDGTPESVARISEGELVLSLKKLGYGVELNMVDRWDAEKRAQAEDCVRSGGAKVAEWLKTLFYGPGKVPGAELSRGEAEAQREQKIKQLPTPPVADQGTESTSVAHAVAGALSGHELRTLPQGKVMRDPPPGTPVTDPLVLRSMNRPEKLPEPIAQRQSTGHKVTLTWGAEKFFPVPSSYQAVEVGPFSIEVDVGTDVDAAMRALTEMAERERDRKLESFARKLKELVGKVNG